MIEYLVGGFAVADGRTATVVLGWDDPNAYGGHPFHLFSGMLDLEGDGPWRFSEGQIIQTDEDHWLAWSYLNWRDAQGEAWKSSIQRGCQACADLLREQETDADT